MHAAGVTDLVLERNEKEAIGDVDELLAKRRGDELRLLRLLLHLRR